MTRKFVKPCVFWGFPGCPQFSSVAQSCPILCDPVDCRTQASLSITNLSGNPPANAGDFRDPSLILRLGRSSGVGNGNPLHYSCLGNPMDRGTWWPLDHEVAKCWTRLSTHSHTRKQASSL